MSYTSYKFYTYLRDKDIKTIFEVGARDCFDTIDLYHKFPGSSIYTYECNPTQIGVCLSTLQQISSEGENTRPNSYKFGNITFHSYGLGETTGDQPFYPYIAGNPGASSFFKRTDYDSSQTLIDNIHMETLESECSTYNVTTIDLLCMDVQGYELNIIKGSGSLIEDKNIRFIIMEMPLREPNRHHLPEGHSKYMGAPSFDEMHIFLVKNGFSMVCSEYENELEFNVLYERR